MEKQFTIKVPDEIWIDSWETGKTETYTYVGPESIKVLVETTDEFDIVEWTENEFDRDIRHNEKVIEFNVTDENVSIAHYIVTNPADFEYEEREVINHDGSLYLEVLHPPIQDYFDLLFKSGDFILEPIIKDPETENERIAKQRLQYVRKYNDAYDFEDEIQIVIDKFIQDTEAYLEKMQTVYPWKYVSIDSTEIPKIPAKLVGEFNTLPAIDQG